MVPEEDHGARKAVMKRSGTKNGRALLVDGERDIRRTLSRYLQLHGMDVVEADTLDEASRQLSAQEDFDLLVTELKTPEHADWDQWKSLVTRNAEISVLIHGGHVDEWDAIRGKLGRTASFIGNPFTLSDFHWAIHQLL